MPLISVIVPVFQVESYLAQCVESILAQSLIDFEMILVDDGSYDTSSVICDAYALCDDRVYVIHQTNGGLSHARNTGIEFSLTSIDNEWITFIDSDDWVSKDNLNSLLNALLSDRAQISLGYTQDVTPATEIQTVAPVEEESCVLTGREACIRCFEVGAPKTTELGKAYFSVSWNKLYRIQLFNDIRFPNGRIHEDTATTYRLFFRADRVSIVNKTTYYYRMTPNSIMRSAFSCKKYDAVMAIDEAMSFFMENHDHELWLLAQEQRRNVCRRLSFAARKAGVYHYVPRQYKAEVLLLAIHRMRMSLDWNEYEFVMYQYYPKLVTIQICIRKLNPLLQKVGFR